MVNGQWYIHDTWYTNIHVHLSHVDLINIFIDLLIHHKRPVCHHLPGLPYRPFRLYLGIEFPIVGVQKPGPSYSPGS